MSSIPFYEIRNDPSCVWTYAHLFAQPGILILHEFPVTESRFRILRESYSYDEIVDELRYCIGSQESAERLASMIVDDLMLKDASFLYPETVRVMIDASIAAVVHDPLLKERLSMMFPHARIFYIPGHDYGPIVRAFEALKAIWTPPGPDFPWHLRSLPSRVREQCAKRFPGGLPQELEI